MNGQLPYEEKDQQFNDLPLPDQEAAWQKMKERLDEDSDERIPPPVLLRNCMGWGLLLLVGLTVAWLVVRPERWWNQTMQTEETSSSPQVQKQPGNALPHNDKEPGSSRSKGKNETGDIAVQQPNSVGRSTGSPAAYRLKKGGAKDTYAGSGMPATAVLPFRKNNAKLQPSVTGNDNPVQKEKEITDQKPAVTTQQSVNSINQQGPEVKDPAKDNVTQSPDSAVQKKVQPSPQPPKKFIVAAGIGLQQLIPIAGQAAVPYSYYGREGSLADYIPSVYLQLHRRGKWYVMGEFRYGAAQSVKEFSYYQNTSYDTANINLTVTNMRLKKTYYHQLPLSFNYYVKPWLSVGVGGMYSRFHGAITEKETNTLNTLTQAKTNVKEIIPIKHFTDSFLYKTQLHILLQADYQWKRFSFGLRYTKDVQPYIKYTTPEGRVDEEKNQSLQLMVRFRIWQSEQVKIQK